MVDWDYLPRKSRVYPEKYCIWNVCSSFHIYRFDIQQSYVLSRNIKEKRLIFSDCELYCSLCTKLFCLIRKDARDEEETFIITWEEDAWRVRGAETERVVAMTNWGLDEAVQRFQRIAKAMGLKEALRDAGVQPGDTVRIGEVELEWQ